MNQYPLVPIGKTDRNGTPLYLGDWLQWDPKEWHHSPFNGKTEKPGPIFQITLENGETQGLGAPGDWENWCTKVEAPSPQEYARLKETQGISFNGHDPRIFTQYEDLLRYVYYRGVQKADRTGTGTRSVFGAQMRFDLKAGFPLVTTKKVHLKSIIAELLWMLRGQSNNNQLKVLGASIWDEWAKENGDLGPIYGHQWRHWPGKAQMFKAEDANGGEVTDQIQHNNGDVILQVTPEIDQIEQVIQLLKTQPHSRRILVSAWNVADLDKMALMPCHTLFQFYTKKLTLAQRMSYAQDIYEEALGFSNCRISASDLSEEQKTQMWLRLEDIGVPQYSLSCQLYQRSADMFLGVPFNLASYAFLTHAIAAKVGMAVDEFIWTGGDCHIYSNHYQQVELQLSRQPFPAPTLKPLRRLPDDHDIGSYKPEDFVLDNYECHPSIKGDVAV